MAGHGLRLLCLDGGGIRGLASLYVLKALLSKVGNPRPCHYFDMICGTSTGGLIAIMLGRLEMTVQACIDAFIIMMDIIFEKRHNLPFNWTNGRIQARYDSEALESCIKSVIREAGFSSDDQMKGCKKSACKVFVVALDNYTKKTVRFTDYVKQGESTMFDEIKIWEAACATCAATTFFKPATIMCGGVHRMFVDGALGTNNPVNQLWIEAQEQFQPLPLEPQIRCLLSIGTGRPPVTSLGDNVLSLMDSIKKIATETQETAETFHEMHQTLADRDGYFRFNPPCIDEVGLDEAGERALVAARTEAYINDPDCKRSMARFRDVNGQDENPKSAPKPVLTKPGRFYDLDQRPKYIKPATSYWQHLTLDSYIVYEKIYNACRSRNGMVHFSTFLHQFNSNRPSPRFIEKIWSRTLTRKQPNIHVSSHNQHLTMATLYMLHIETASNSSGPPDIDQDQRESLKRFAKWVPCKCKNNCDKEWNFVNEVGLSKGGNAKQKCGVERYLESGPFRNLFGRADGVALVQMRELWCQAS